MRNEERFTRISCERCLDTGEWFTCQDGGLCYEDDCRRTECPDCGKTWNWSCPL